MSGIKHAGEVELQKLVLISSSGTAIDLTELVININIYESVFSHAMSGSILIGDTNNLSVNLPIIGQEYLSLKLNTPTLEDKAIDYSENVFVVYKIKQRESDSLMQVLELQFTTPGPTIIEVDKNRNIYIPNIFTPNGDGFNSIFQPIAGVGVRKMNYFRVYDRWGAMLHERLEVDGNDLSFENPAVAWDGKFKGKEVNQGVYIYLAEIEFLDGRVLLYRGDVTLVK